jgi:hypothetical protein
MVPVSPSRRPPRHHPPPPLEANTHAADAVPLPATNSSGGPNAEVDNFVEAFLLSLPEIGAGDDANFLSEGGTADKIDTAPPPARLLFTIHLPGGADDNEEGIVLPDAPRGSIFPSAVPTVQNRFFNQNPESNDEGYDSEGGLPYFADKEEVNADNYNEATLIDDAHPPPGEAKSVQAVAAQTPKLTVEGVTLLNVAQLKEELKRRGRSIAGKKGDLQACLKEVIVLNVPVALGGGELVRHHESMSGLDIMARWELLTPKDKPIPEPKSKDPSLRPPTELDGSMNPKYAMKETFVRGSFNMITIIR